MLFMLFRESSEYRQSQQISADGGVLVVQMEVSWYENIGQLRLAPALRCTICLVLQFLELFVCHIVFSHAFSYRFGDNCAVLTVHSSLRTPHCALLIVHSLLCTPHCTLLTVHSSLYTPHCALLSVQSLLCTPHCALSLCSLHHQCSQQCNQ